MRTMLSVAIAAISLATPYALAGGTVIQAGTDYWRTVDGSASVEFGAWIPPIPADFFGPGSQPFEGVVQLQGAPLGPPTGNTDTIVRRIADTPPLDPGQPSQVQIEFVALSLVSTQPIVVQPGNQLWDVAITYNPGDPAAGQFQVVLDSPTSGFCGYQLNFLPTIVFTPSGGGAPLTFPLPPSFFQPLNGSPTPFTTLLPPVLFENQGPNMLPVAPMPLMGPGLQLRLEAALPVDGPPDCNNNGADDADDIASGSSLDSNGNGTPDECEIVATGVQYSWPDLGGGFVERFSQHGAIKITVPEPAAGQIGWFNAVLGDSGWAIQNFPVHEINSAGAMRTIVIPVPLPTESGVALDQATMIFAYTPEPLEFAPPPTSLALDILINEHVINPGEFANVPVLLPITPGPIGPFINPFIPIIWETTGRRDVPGVNEDTNHCAPGSAARSFAWLDSTYCLGLPADCDEAQEIYDMLRDMNHMDTDAGGTESIDKMVEGIQQLIDDKGLGDDLTVEYDSDTSGDTVFDALEAGYDVMGIIYWRNADGTINGGHAITIVGATRCGENVVIDYRDDVHGTDSQGDGDADSDDTKGGKIGPSAGGGSTLEGHGRNSWEGIVKICPTRKRIAEAAMKWALGDTAGGGTTEGIIPLIDRILNEGYVPTADELIALFEWACNLEDTACSLLSQIMACGTPEMLALAESIKADAAAAKDSILNYILSGDPTDLNAADTALDADFEQALTDLLVLLDCDGNGVDDKLDIARGNLHDANHNMVPDECDCLADWNSDGEVNVPDIFAFLSDWFAGDADADHDGVTAVPDIFVFLSLWFAGCP